MIVKVICCDVISNKIKSVGSVCSSKNIGLEIRIIICVPCERIIEILS